MPVTIKQSIIAIEGIEVYGYHGVYPIEKSQGNRFQVDVYLSSNMDTAAHTDALSDTVDYHAVYKSILELMQPPVHLLETLVTKIGLHILSEFASITSVKVRVRKLKPISMELCEQTYVERVFENIP
ncbi:MAG: dihydroneopterin aldolase [Bacteroidota bacterium]